MELIFCGALAKLAGKPRLSRPGNPATLGQLLEELAADYSELIATIIPVNTGDLSPEIIVMVNGKTVRELSMPLGEHDVITFMLTISGG